MEPRGFAIFVLQKALENQDGGLITFQKKRPESDLFLASLSIIMLNQVTYNEDSTKTSDERICGSHHGREPWQFKNTVFLKPVGIKQTINQLSLPIVPRKLQLKFQYLSFGGLMQNLIEFKEQAPSPQSKELNPVEPPVEYEGPSTSHEKRYCQMQQDLTFTTPSMDRLNELNIETLENDQDLSKKGRKSLYNKAQFPHLIEGAKDFLKKNNFQLELLLQQPEYQVLNGSNDLQSYIIKFITNNKTYQKRKNKDKKGTKSDNSKCETQTQKSESIKSSYLEVINPQNEGVAFIKAPYGSITQNSNVNQEISSDYYKQYTIIKPEDRYSFLEQILSRNLESLVDFLKILKGYNNPALSKGLFNIIYELLINNKLSIGEQSRIFVQALLFYNLEQVEISDELVKRMMIELRYKPDIDQTLQLANLVFVNELGCFAQNEAELILLDQANIGIVPLMFSTFTFFNVDYQVSRQLPNSLLILNYPFIRMLKTNNGLDIIRNIDYSCLQDFIYICSFANSPDFVSLSQFIICIREIYKDKWALMDQQDFIFCLNSLKTELQKRNPLWVGQINSIQELLSDLTYIQVEKNIKNRPDIIQLAVQGDKTLITQFKEKPKEMQSLSQESVSFILKQFKHLNKDNEEILRFCKDSSASETFVDKTQEMIQERLKFPFHSLQLLCLKYLQSIQTKQNFINFGIGNGKTVLCVSNALYFALSERLNTFIICKNEYLAMRDQKRFEEIITSFGLLTNLNKHNNDLGIYYYTQKQLELAMKDSAFKKIWKDSLVILDEYDWILFDGPVQTMLKLMKYMKKAQRLICFTGSQLKPIEQQCLNSFFGTGAVIFPTLSQVHGDKKFHLKSELIHTNQACYIGRLKELISSNIKLTPIIIVAGQTYEMIEVILGKWKDISFYSMKKTKNSKVDSILKERFLQKNQLGHYGVYLFNEALGRGTDLNTTHEIENNGGLYEIITDVFTQRSQEQVVGRVGRLENKGRWHHVLYVQGCKEQLSSYVKTIQQQWDNEDYLKCQSLLSELCSSKVRTKSQSRIQQDKQAIITETISESNVITNEEQTCRSLEQELTVAQIDVVEEVVLPAIIPPADQSNNESTNKQMTDLVKKTLLKHPAISNEGQALSIMAKASKNNLNYETEVQEGNIMKRKRDQKAEQKKAFKSEMNDNAIRDKRHQRTLRAKVRKNYCED